MSTAESENEWEVVPVNIALLGNYQRQASIWHPECVVCIWLPALFGEGMQFESRPQLHIRNKDQIICTINNIIIQCVLTLFSCLILSHMIYQQTRARLGYRGLQVEV